MRQDKNVIGSKGKLEENEKLTKKAEKDLALLVNSQLNMSLHVPR